MLGISQLSSGCMESIMTGNDFDKPVLQILGTKKIAGGEGNERYRLLVSDGKYLNSFAMLATQLNELYTQGNLVEYTIIRVDRYITSMVNKSEKGDKRVLIILELTVLNHGSEVGKKIGNPVPFTGEAAVNKATVSSASTSKVKETSNGSSIAKKPATSFDTPSYRHNASLSNTICSTLTVPIASLSPYQNKWVIKARVVGKSMVRTWCNAKGEGKLFSMDLVDESGEIRATAFKDTCDKYYDMIRVDQVYLISKCQLKPANKQFNTLKNDYEMTFTNDTVLQLVEEAVPHIPQMKYNLVPISQIANMETHASVDVIGVCSEIGEVHCFVGRTNHREYRKRDITLVDTSMASIQLCLWGDDAITFAGHDSPILLIKGSRVTEFGGSKTINSSIGSIMRLNPDIPEGHKLRGWYDNGGAEKITNNISARSGIGNLSADWMTFHEVRAKNLGTGDKPDYFQLKAVVHIIKSSNAVYKACPQSECNKKVIDEGNGHYRCEKCNAIFPEFKYRLLINMSIGDWTSNRWVTCFSDLGEQILGKNAQEIGEALDTNPEAAEEIFSSINFKAFIFKLRTKVEIFGDMHRNKITVMKVYPINYSDYNKYLIKNMHEITGVGNE